MAISAKEYQKRLIPLLNQSTLRQMINEIVLSDNEKLKAEKINEFEQGVRPDGTRIGTYRDPEYKQIKLAQNPKADGYVDLLYTWRTARSLFVHIGSEPNGYLFGWTDNYNLVGKYGLDILGLNQEWFLKRQKDIYRYTMIFQIKKQYKIA